MTALQGFYASSGSDASVNQPGAAGEQRREFFPVDREQPQPQQQQLGSPGYYDEPPMDFSSFGPPEQSRFYNNGDAYGDEPNAYMEDRQRAINGGRSRFYPQGNQMPLEAFPVLSQIAGVSWQGSVQYVDGDLKYALPTTARGGGGGGGSGRQNAGLRYDLQPDGTVYLSISLGGKRIEMRGRMDDGRMSGGMGGEPQQRRRQDGMPQSLQRQRVSRRAPGYPGSIRLDPIDEQAPNYMVLTEIYPDTLLIQEMDRFTGSTVLTASLSVVNPDEIIQISHEIGEEGVPILGHQVWALSRQGTPSTRGRGGRGQSSPPSRRVSTGMPQSVSNINARRGNAPPQRLYPVLSKFSGLTWEGACRQIEGDLNPASRENPRIVEGGSRFDIIDGENVILTTFVRSQSTGQTEAIEMRGRRMDGPGSPIRLDMEEGPNTMIIAEVAPHALLINEINRETGQILFTASLYLANDDEVIQVSHQLSQQRGDPLMPIDMHQLWRLYPSPEDISMGMGMNMGMNMGRTSVNNKVNNNVYRSDWDDGVIEPNAPGPRNINDRRVRMGGQGMKPNFEGATRVGRGTGNGNNQRRVDNPRERNNPNSRQPTRSRAGEEGRFHNRDSFVNGDADNLWLLNRTPEQTRASFLQKFDQVGEGGWDSEFGLGGYDWINDPSLSSEIRTRHPVLSKIAGVDWNGSCRYIIGDTKPDSIMLLSGGMHYDLTDDGVCTMTTNLIFGDGRSRQVRMRGFREQGASSLKLYPLEDSEPVYTVLTELTPDTILINEIDSDTGKVIYTASLSISSDGNELVQVTHEMGDGLRMPVEGHQIWRMKRFGEASSSLTRRKPRPSRTTSSVMEEVFPVLSAIDGAGWQGTFRFINGDLERSYNFEASGKMWYDLNRNGTCILTVVSSLPDGSSRYVQMKGDKGLNPQDPIRLDPLDGNGPNFMLITELPPDTVLLSEIDSSTGKLVSTASLSVYRNEVIQVSHEIGNSTRFDGHQVARLKRTKDLSSSSRGTMAYLLNGGPGENDYYSRGGQSDDLVDLFPVLNQIDGINWQGFCKEVDGNMRDRRNRAAMSGGMRYDLHQNGTCTMTSVLEYPDGRSHEIRLQGRRVGNSAKRSIRLDPIGAESPFYTVLTEVPPDTILLNEVDKATNKVIFTASVSITDPDELIQISREVDDRGESLDGHKVWRLRRSRTLGRRQRQQQNQNWRNSHAYQSPGSDNFNANAYNENNDPYANNNNQGYRVDRRPSSSQNQGFPTSSGSQATSRGEQTYFTRGYRSSDQSYGTENNARGGVGGRGPHQSATGGSQPFMSDREKFYSQRASYDDTYSGSYDSRAASFGTENTSNRPFGGN